VAVNPGHPSSAVISVMGVSAQSFQLPARRAFLKIGRFRPVR
jgi:hypothetical protein